MTSRAETSDYRETVATSQKQGFASLSGQARDLARPNWVEIDSDAIRNNLSVVRGLLSPGTKVFGALKANAYGFGVVGVAQHLAAAGIDGVTVSDLEDAIQLREAGVECPILLYAGYLPSDAVVEAVTRYRITPTIYDQTSADLFIARSDRPTAFVVKLEVGLERIGIPTEKAIPFIARLLASPHLSLAGVNTHLHVPAGHPAVVDYLRWQAARFRDGIASLRSAGIAVPLAIAESTGVFQVLSDLRLGGADPGQLLFGLSPDGGPNKVAGLQPALKAIKSRLIQVRGVGRADHFDIAPYPLRADMRVGIIPMGMRDRIPALTGSHVLVGGRRVPILGSPALEYTRVDLTEVPAAKVGDEVVILGAQGDENMPIEEVVAHQKQRRGADITVAIPPAMPRIYMSSH